MKIYVNLTIKEDSEDFIFTLEDILEATDYYYNEEDWSKASQERKDRLIKETVEYNMCKPELKINWIEKE